VAGRLSGAMTVVGGYVVTDRMLQMFKLRPAPPAKPKSEPGAES
jgi:NAD/NADP transhydrogenase alpha subunit